MKKRILLGLLTLIGITFTSCNEGENPSIEQNSNHIDEFMKSVAMVTNKTPIINSKTTSKSNSKDLGVVTMELHNYNPDFDLRDLYTVQGMDFTDNGKFNDEVANDGIYTSVNTFKMNETSKFGKANEKQLIVSEIFKYKTTMDFQNATNKGKIKIGCKMRPTRTGESWFGFSCSSGCIELYDCSFDIEIEW